MPTGKKPAKIASKLLKSKTEKNQLRPLQEVRCHKRQIKRKLRKTQSNSRVNICCNCILDLLSAINSACEGFLPRMLVRLQGLIRMLVAHAASFSICDYRVKKLE